MLKKMILMILLLSLLCSVAPSVLADPVSGDVAILYTNDIHCAFLSEEGLNFSHLSALKKDLASRYSYVTTVDAGDAIQGNAIGTLSGGTLPVEIMNHIGYDFAVLGNHEFDYGIDTALSLNTLSNAQYLACNFRDLTSNTTPLPPYALVTYGDFTIGYVGISTPETLSKSTPTFFMDEDGNYIYSFCQGDNGQELYSAVQQAVDAATAEGADIVIAIAHLGIDEASKPWTSPEVIANTHGIHAVIDGHSHSLIEGQYVSNALGDSVLLTSTGTAMESIGVLTVKSNGEIVSHIISAYDKVDPDTEAFLEDIQAQLSDQLETVVCSSDFDLITHDPETGNRLIRNQETNLGDLVADAYRIVMEADIGICNGGGIRAPIAAGPVTYGDLLAVQPYDNQMCMVEASGQEILDLLEVGSMYMPQENGSFFHVSGLKYTIDTTIPSTVTMDETGFLKDLGASRRVRDVQILLPDGSYAPLDPEKIYTVASHDYLIKYGGSGVRFFEDNTIVRDDVMPDSQLLVNYFQKHLGSQIPEAYRDPQGEGRITVRTAEQLPQTGDPVPPAVPVLIIAVTLLTLLTLTKRKGDAL